MGLTLSKPWGNLRMDVEMDSISLNGRTETNKKLFNKTSIVMGLDSTTGLKMTSISGAGRTVRNILMGSKSIQMETGTRVTLKMITTTVKVSNMRVQTSSTMKEIGKTNIPAGKVNSCSRILMGSKWKFLLNSTMTETSGRHYVKVSEAAGS